jgi:hypothetical protein
VTGELVDRFKPALIAVVALIAGLVVAISPAVAAILAIGGALYFVAGGIQRFIADWKEMSFLDAWLNGWIDEINLLVDGVNLLLSAVGKEIPHLQRIRPNERLAPGDGVLAPAYGPAMPNDWGMSGAQFYSPAAGPVTSSTSHSETHVGEVNIVTNDPKKMGREWDKHVRDGQSPVGL